MFYRGVADDEPTTTMVCGVDHRPVLTSTVPGRLPVHPQHRQVVPDAALLPAELNERNTIVLFSDFEKLGATTLYGEP